MDRILRDSKIKKERDSVRSLQDLGDEFGLTRERIRQILVERFGTADISEFYTTVDMMRLGRCSIESLHKLRRKGIISSTMIGIWSPKALGALLEHRKCKMCQAPLPQGRSVYCSDPCQIEGAEYKNKSDEARAKHNAIVLASYHRKKEEV